MVHAGAPGALGRMGVFHGHRRMPKKPRHVPAAPVIASVATLKDLRKATGHTQEDLADAMGVGQGTVSRIEKRHDMLVSTLQHYVESMGGTLQILASFPDRPPLRVERLGKKSTPAPAAGAGLPKKTDS